MLITPQFLKSGNSSKIFGKYYANNRLIIEGVHNWGEETRIQILALQYINFCLGWTNYFISLQLILHLLKKYK